MTSLLQHPQPYAPILPLLKQSPSAEDPIPLLASSVLSSLLSYGLMAGGTQASQIDDALPKLYAYIATLARSSDAGLQDIAVQEYSALLRTAKSRQYFWDQRKDTLGPLIDTLRSATGGARDGDSTLVGRGGSIRSTAESSVGSNVGLQLLYHVLLVIWQLSFEGKLVGKGLDEYVCYKSLRQNYVALTFLTGITTSSLCTLRFYVFRPRRRRLDSCWPLLATCFLRTAMPLCQL